MKYEKSWSDLKKEISIPDCVGIIVLIAFMISFALFFSAILKFLGEL